jgi:hypothetical protein
MISEQARLDAFLRDDAERRLVQDLGRTVMIKVTAAIIGIMAVFGLLATADAAIMLWGTAR